MRVNTSWVCRSICGQQQKHIKQPCPQVFHSLSAKYPDDMVTWHLNHTPTLTNCSRSLESRNSCFLPGEIIIFVSWLWRLFFSLKSVMTACFGVRKGWLLAGQSADLSKRNCSWIEKSLIHDSTSYWYRVLIIKCFIGNTTCGRGLQPAVLEALSCCSLWLHKTTCEYYYMLVFVILLHSRQSVKVEKYNKWINRLFQ